MKTLFLDFDGVLHTVYGPAFVHVNALADVLEGHQVEIVITSSHREHQSIDNLITRLQRLGQFVVGKTVVLTGGHVRQREIEDWLACHTYTDFRVLDDDHRLFSPDWGPLILCNGNKGLQKAELDELAKWLVL